MDRRDSIGIARTSIRHGRPEEGMQIFVDMLNALEPISSGYLASFQRARPRVIRDLGDYCPDYESNTQVMALLAQADARLAELKELSVAVDASLPKFPPITLMTPEEAASDWIGFPPYEGNGDVFAVEQLETFTGALDDDGLRVWFNKAAEDYDPQAERNDHLMLSPLRLYPVGNEAAQVGVVFLMAARMEKAWPARVFSVIAPQIEAQGPDNKAAVLARDIIDSTQNFGDDLAALARKAGITRLTA